MSDETNMKGRKMKKVLCVVLLAVAGLGVASCEYPTADPVNNDIGFKPSYAYGSDAYQWTTGPGLPWTWWYASSFAAARQTQVGGPAWSYVGGVWPFQAPTVIVVEVGQCGFADAIACTTTSTVNGHIVRGKIVLDSDWLWLDQNVAINAMLHEMGHVAGLEHYSGSFPDGRQAMFPSYGGGSPVTDYRQGDVWGLQWEVAH